MLGNGGKDGESPDPIEQIIAEIERSEDFGSFIRALGVAVTALRTAIRRQPDPAHRYAMLAGAAMEGLREIERLHSEILDTQPRSRKSAAAPMSAVHPDRQPNVVSIRRAT